MPRSLRASVLGCLRLVRIRLAAGAAGVLGTDVFQAHRHAWAGRIGIGEEPSPWVEEVEGVGGKRSVAGEYIQPSAIRVPCAIGDDGLQESR